MLIVIVALGTTDLLFALDSIPAIYGLTKEPYLVFTANVFALMGLRQLYFLIGGLLERLVYLSLGLSVVLGFIGVKLVLEALHENELPFINGGEHVDAYRRSRSGSRWPVILGTLAVTTVASLLKVATRPSGARPSRPSTDDEGRWRRTARSRPSETDKTKVLVDPTWWAVAVGGLIVGFVVGLTGMGGGALMTPMMILVFDVQPLAAVSSDLVASMIMKPVGGAVHLRRGTVNKEPREVAGDRLGALRVLRRAAAAGIGDGEDRGGRQDQPRRRAALRGRSRWWPRRCWTCARRSGCSSPRPPAGEVVDSGRAIRVRPIPTLLIGIIGGLVVGMTSVGSGSLMIVSLLLLYPSSGPASWSAPTSCRRCRWSPRRPSGTSCSATSSST